MQIYSEKALCNPYLFAKLISGAARTRMKSLGADSLKLEYADATVWLYTQCLPGPDTNFADIGDLVLASRSLKLFFSELWLVLGTSDTRTDTRFYDSVHSMLIQAGQYVKSRRVYVFLRASRSKTIMRALSHMTVLGLLRVPLVFVVFGLPTELLDFFTTETQSRQWSVAVCRERNFREIELAFSSGVHGCAPHPYAIIIASPGA